MAEKVVPFADIELKHLKHNENTIKVGEEVYIDFYHRQECFACHSRAPGYSSFRSEGPWEFTCPKCGSQWSVCMSEKIIDNRRRILKLVRDIDRKIGQALRIGMH